MKILGIDPGLATVGLGLIETTELQNYTALDWLTIETHASQPLPERLCELQSDLLEYLNEHKPDLVVIEQLYFATNQKTAIDVAQARGVLVATVAQNNLPIIDVTPMQLKSTITGDGGADKQQMQEMLKVLLKLDEVPQPDDAADALGLAVYGSIVGRYSV